jgi:hypothetical protein
LSLHNRLKFEDPLRNKQLQQHTPCLFALLVIISCGFLVAVCANLVQDSKLLSVPIAICMGLSLWALEKIEGKVRLRTDATSPKVWESHTVAVIVGGIAFLACLPTLNTYFLTDEFALLHAFHQLSAAQFLHLLQMDTRVFVSGDARQEFRPFYGLYYAWGYDGWGLRPWGYHLCEMFFHAIVSVLVFLIVNVLVPGNLRRAGFAGILFAVQPPNAQATSLIVGAVAESLPAIFYLAALLFFIRFRRGSHRWSIAISICSFVACLLTKESAVTLPVILLLYDWFRIATEGTARLFREGNKKWEHWPELIMPYIPYGILLAFYLEWRRKVLSSFLRETNWGSQAHTEIASPVGYGTHVAHFAKHIWQLQLFNFENLLPYSVPVMGLVLGLLTVWSAALFLRRKEIDRPIALLVSFGFIWYMITNIPYVIEGQVPYHLYLPAIGTCIVVACTAFPGGSNFKQRAQFTRVFGVVLLVLFSTMQMWKGDAQYARLGSMSAQMAKQLAVSLKNVPAGEMTVIWPGNSELIASGWGEGIMPFSVQPPFTQADLSERKSLVSHPDMTCCGDEVWWQNVEPILEELARPSSEQITVSLLSWNDKTTMFDLTSRPISRKLFMDSVDATLGGPPESFESLDDDQAIRLVQSLSRLVVNGR